MTTKEVKIQLALGSLTYDMKRELTVNKRTSKKILTILSTDENDENWAIRCRVADNPNTPKETLTKLSTDKDWWIRRKVANNTNTPKRALYKLSVDKNYAIRICVANNPNAPKKVLKKL